MKPFGKRHLDLNLFFFLFLDTIIRMRESNEVVDRDAVLRYFAGKEVLSHYEEATLKMGLRKSEELIFQGILQSGI